MHTEIVMTLTSEELEKICINAVRLSGNTIKSLGEDGRIGVRISGKDEPVTKSDLGVSAAWKKYFEACRFPIKVLTEESRNEPFYSPPDAKYLGIGDELDGTGNNKRARGIIPSCAIFTIFDNSNLRQVEGMENADGVFHNLAPKFSDAIAAAVLNHDTGDLWTASRGKGCFYDGKRVFTSKATGLGKDTYLYIDKGPCPTPELSLRVSNLERKCWPRNISCAGIHFAGVASGSYSGWDGFLSFLQKPEELAAGYLLVSEAGGVVIDPEGQDIGAKVFDWNKIYEIIAAATPQLSGEILKNVLSKEKASELAALLDSAQKFG